MKYVITEKWSSAGQKIRYVKDIIFSDVGVKIEYTDHLSLAARVSDKRIAEAFASCVPGGKVKAEAINPKTHGKRSIGEIVW